LAFEESSEVQARALFLTALALAGCGPELDPPSEIKGLRVLAIQKDKPYAKPTDSVTLRMLLHDALSSPEAPRPLQIFWYGGCRNPPGDLFHRCFDAVADLASGIPPGGALPSGNQVFVLNNQPGDDGIPDDIISSRPPPPDPRFPRYGLIYVFFAACAGELKLVPQRDELAFPIGCFGPDNTQLGANDFVAGYTALYVYDEFTNTNPFATDFLVDGISLDNDSECLDCLRLPPCDPDDLACALPPTEVPPCDPQAPAAHCVPACPDDGDESCPDTPIQPVVPREVAEPDSVSAAVYGRDVGEQMWINYYVDRGSVASPVRLLNDALDGFNDDHATDFRAPKDPGPVNVWAVIHDNRGGVGWAQATLRVY
jgi:hypothetical protein